MQISSTNEQSFPIFRLKSKPKKSSSDEILFQPFSYYVFTVLLEVQYLHAYKWVTP